MSASSNKDIINKYFPPNNLGSRPASTPTAPTTPSSLQELLERSRLPDKSGPIAVGQPEDEEGGFGKFIGKITGAAGDVLDASGNYLARPALGAISKVMASDPVQGALSAVGVDSLSDEEAERILDANSFTAAWRERSKDMEWWEKMAAEIVVDPTTWVSGGSVAALSKLPAFSRAIQSSPTVARAFLNVQQGADLFDRAQALPITAPLKAAKGIISNPVTKKLMGVDPLAATSKSQMVSKVRQSDTAVRAFLDRNVATAPDQGNLLSVSRQEGASGLVDSMPRVNAERTITTLTNAAPADRTRLLGQMKSPEVSEIWKQVETDPNNPLYNDVLSSMRSRGFITDRTTPGRTEFTGALERARPFDLNSLSRQNQTFVSSLSDALDTGNQTIVDSVLSTATNRQKRLAFDWAGSSNHANKSLVDANLTGRGELRTIAPVVTPETNRRLAQSIQGVQRSRGIPGNPATSEPQIAITGRVIDAERTVDNVVQFLDVTIRNSGAATPMKDFVAENLKEIGASLNPDHFTARNLWADPTSRQHLSRAMSAATEDEARTHLGLMYQGLNMRHAAWGTVHPAGAGLIDKLIPQIRRTKDNINAPKYGGYDAYQSVVSDTDMKVLEEMYQNPEVLKFQEVYEADRLKMAELFESTPGFTMTDSTTVRDILGARALMNPADVEKVNSFLKKYDMNEDSFSKNASRSFKNRVSRTPTKTAYEEYTVREAYTDKLIDKWTLQVADEFGIDMKTKSNEIMRALGWFPKAWREQALITVRYHAANILDMSIKSLIYGVNPLRSYNGKDTAKTLGINSLPTEVFVGADTRDLSQITNLTEFMGANDQSALPGVLGKVSQFNRAFARGTENTFREWAWNNGLKDSLQAFREPFNAEIRRLMPGRAGADLEKDLAGLGEEFARTKGIAFDSQKLYDLAIARGASTDAANTLSRQWDDAVQQASRKGVESANLIHFDFDKTYNIEDKLFLRKILPFHFFASRNLPTYAETFANNPVLQNIVASFADLSEQDRIDMELPARLQGMVPGGILNRDLPTDFLGSILGPNTVFINPMAVFSVLDQTKNVGRFVDGDPYAEDVPFFSRAKVGQILDRGAGLGLSPAPWVNIPLSALGFYGAEDEQMPLLRHTGIIEAATGVDLGEGLLRDLTAEIRAATYDGKRVKTHTGSQFKDNAIVTRMVESADAFAENNPQYSPAQVKRVFQDAAKEGPGNPIWDQTAKEVQREELKRQFRAMWFPLPAKDATERGIDISVAREGMPSNLNDNPALVALLKRTGAKSVAGKGFTRPGLVDAQGNRIWENSGSTSSGSGSSGNDSSNLFAWGGGVWGPDKPAPFNNEVAFEAYTQWARNPRTQGSKSPDVFFEAYGIT